MGTTGYDPSNRRIGKLLPEFTGSFYAWSGWDLTEAYDIGFQPTTVWLEGSVMDEHLGYVSRDPSSGTWSRFNYVQGHTRDIAKVTDASGAVVEMYEFDPYGRMSVFTPSGSSNGTVPTVPGQIYGFAGRQMDPETGLVYYRHRYYQPMHGRFLTSDPAGLWVDQFAHGNGYQYVGSVPHNRIDPFGLYTTVIIMASPNATPKDLEIVTAYATSVAQSDPDGGQVIVVTATPGGKDKDGKDVPPTSRAGKPTAVDPKNGKKKTPKEGAEHKLVIANEHGVHAPPIPFAIDDPVSHLSMDLEHIVRAILVGSDPTAVPPTDPPPPPPEGQKFSHVLISMCHGTTDDRRPKDKPRAPHQVPPAKGKGKEEDPTAKDTVDMRRPNMPRRMADYLGQATYSFDCIVFRSKDGKHYLEKEEKTEAAPEPVQPHPSRGGK